MNVEGQVLAALAEQPAGGGALVRRLGGEPGRTFTTLHRLEAAGCLVATGSTYRLTRAGRRELRLQRLLARTLTRAR